MADYIDEVINREGGAKVTNVPGDHGHLTKWGIAQAAHPDVDILHLTYEDARAIYQREYLVKPGIDKVEPEFLRAQVFDFGVNAGPPRAITMLQHILHVRRDGDLGPVSLGALAKRDPVEVNNLLVGMREAYYRDIVAHAPKQQKFLKGWVKRARSFWIDTARSASSDTHAAQPPADAGRNAPGHEG